MVGTKGGHSRTGPTTWDEALATAYANDLTSVDNAG